LLALARATLTAHLSGTRLEVVAGPAPGGANPRGAFVTVTVSGDLRGCVGRVQSSRPLADLVRELVIAAARDDERFAPITKEELATVRIEISVLSEPVPLHPVAAERITVGRDGLLVRRGRASALLLPQVAPEHGWGTEVFLQATCRKAGLAADAWRDAATEVFTFQAEVFGEDG